MFIQYIYWLRMMDAIGETQSEIFEGSLSQSIRESSLCPHSFALRS